MVLQRQPTKAGAPPPRPTCFGDGYQPPPHRTYDLATRNAHPLDEGIVFLELPHIYLRTCGRRQPFSESSTGVAHQFGSVFDASVCYEMMRSSTSQRWPRFEYVLDARHVDDELTSDRGCLIRSGTRTVASVRPHDVDGMSGRQIRGMLTEMQIGVPTSADVIYTFEREMTFKEICQAWKDNGAFACNRGTEAHLQMQLCIEGEPYRCDDPEVLCGLRVLDLLPNEWEAFAAEKEIYSDRADLAGSVDLIIRNTRTQQLAIIDWKCSDKLRDKLYSFGYKKQRAPMHHLDDSDGAQYALQLSIYRWILAEEYGYDVSCLILVSLHPDKPFFTEVPYLEEEVDYIMRDRIATHAARTMCPDRCPLSDVALHDPVSVVIDDQNAIVDRKTALSRDIEPGAVDEATRDRVASFVLAHKATVSAPEKLVPWRRLMPKEGIYPSIFVLAESDLPCPPRKLGIGGSSS